MASPAESFKNWIKGLSDEWKALVKGWLIDAGSLAGEVFMNIMAKSMSKKMAPLIAEIKKTPDMPQWLIGLLDEMANPTGEGTAWLLNNAAGVALGSSLGRILDAFLNPLAYAANYATKNQHIDVKTLIGMWHKRKMAGWKQLDTGDGALLNYLHMWGLDDWNITSLINMGYVNLPSDVVAPVWLRDKTKWEKYWDDVRAGGVSDDRIELLKEAAYKMPTPQDVVAFLAHEVFEPNMRSKYGLDDEWENVDKSLFDKIGLKEDMALNYWRNHWQHPAFTQIQELLHRRLLTEKDVYDWFKLVEIPPYWRDGLIKAAYYPYTRVDVRRMWDLGVITDQELYDTYRDLGYDDTHARNLSTWTKVYQRYPELLARYKNGYINLEEVRSELTSYGMPPDRVQWLIETKIKKEATTRTVAERDLTKAEIIKFYKIDPGNYEQAAQLLVNMGYDPDEAAFILAINTEVPTETLSEAEKVAIDTVRRRRRQRLISREEEIAQLSQIGLSGELTLAYADNDDLRLAKVAGEATE